VNIVGKKHKPIGTAPALALVNPKYPRNVGAAIRAASCFGLKQVWFTGDRVKLDTKERLPREERMKGYSEVELVQFDYFVDQFPDAVPVAIEISPTAEVLTTFEHPENALYIFGPEDGNVPQMIKRHCHRFVAIPTRHCTNLAAAVYIVLYDRQHKRMMTGLEPIPTACQMLSENRGPWETGEDFFKSAEMG